MGNEITKCIRMSFSFATSKMKMGLNKDGKVLLIDRAGKLKPVIIFQLSKKQLLAISAICIPV